MASKKNTTANLYRIALIGLGPHARRIYWPLLKNHCLLVVDLSKTHEVITNLVCNDDTINSKNLTILYADQTPLSKVKSVLQSAAVTHMVLSTPPEHRMVYLRMGIQLNLQILADKPVSAVFGLATRPGMASRLQEDIDELLQLLATTHGTPGSPSVTVQTQRRWHTGYVRVFEILKEAVQQTQLPITSMTIAHCDGMWTMPHEAERTSHPYNTGYGKLCHSGYHFLDLASWLLSADKRALPLQVVSATARHLDETLALEDGPSLLMRQESTNHYLPHSLVGNEYGETDVYASVERRDSEGRLVTHLDFRLEQTGLSNRTSTQTPRDTYKGIGRLRHESVVIHLGHVLVLRVDSFQDGNTDDDHHFQVTIYRNTRVFPNHPRRVVLDFGEPLHNEKARAACVHAFLENRADKSSLSSHRPVVDLLVALYDSIAQQFRNSRGRPRLLPDILLPTECQQIVDATKDSFAPKKSTRRGPPVRNNERCLYNASPELCGAVLERLCRAGIWAPLQDWRVESVNNKWRVNRYTNGTEFFPHFDSGYQFDAYRRTLLSLVIYLNDDFEGGETVFFYPNELRFTPELGFGLVFPHFGPQSPLHAGKPVHGSRVKIIARTDVTFVRTTLLSPGLPLPDGRVRHCVLLMGPPGAGKGTQCRRLAAALDRPSERWCYLDFGTLVRNAVHDPHSSVGAAIRSLHSQRLNGTRKKNGWLPADIVSRLIGNFLVCSGKSHVVFDGFPRMRSQSLMFEGAEWHMVVAVELYAREQVLQRRLTGRYIHRSSGRTYHKPDVWPPSKEDEGLLERRQEDLDPESIAARMRDYRQDTLPLIEHFQKRNQLVKVDSEEGINDLTLRLASIVRRRLLEAQAILVPLDKLKITSTRKVHHDYNLCSRPGFTGMRLEGTTQDWFVKVGPTDLNVPWLVCPALAREATLTPLSRYYECDGVAWMAVPWVNDAITAKKFVKDHKHDESMRIMDFVFQLGEYLSRLHKRDRNKTLHGLETMSSLLQIRPFLLDTPRLSQPPDKYEAFQFQNDGAMTRDSNPLPVVLLHGDFCLPNILVCPTSGEIKGTVDKGRAFVGSAAFDLALGYWSISYNCGSRRFGEHFLEAYGLTGDAHHGEELEAYAKLFPRLS